MGHLLLGSAPILAALPDIVTVTADAFPRSAGGAACCGTHTNAGGLGGFTHTHTQMATDALFYTGF